MMPILSYGKESSRLVQPVADQNTWHLILRKATGGPASQQFLSANQFANKSEIEQGNCCGIASEKLFFVRQKSSFRVK
jgi:hypothetical protein